jgi:hypothetical protein
LRHDRKPRNPSRPAHAMTGRHRLLAWLALPLLSSCMVLPRTFEVYDPDCHVVARHMALQAVQIASIQHCANNECAVLIVAVAATAAASAMISGSIVVVGNVVYWFEKQGRCLRDPSDFAPNPHEDKP